MPNFKHVSQNSNFEMSYTQLHNAHNFKPMHATGHTIALTFIVDIDFHSHQVTSLIVVFLCACNFMFIFV